MSRKKALLIVQGINSNREYMKPTVPIISAFMDRYAVKEYAYTEDILDGTLTSKFADKADFIPYFLNHKKRLQVCRLVNEKIASLNLLGYDVDVLAHSLGGVIALQSGRRKLPIYVNRMICLQSPIHNKIYGWFVRGRLARYSGGLTIKNLVTTYNKNDFWVAHKGLSAEGLKKFIKSMSNIIVNYSSHDAGDGHDWQKALKDLIIRGTV
jgi:hypothetical protein